RDLSSSKSENCSTECLISNGLDEARTLNNDDHNNIVDLSSDISTALHDPLSLNHSSNDGDLQITNLNLSFSPNLQTNCGDNSVHNKDGNLHVVMQTGTQSEQCKPDSTTKSTTSVSQNSGPCECV
ncbi:Hypothetical predicted protein, partial [Paramuricea clavata]